MQVQLARLVATGHLFTASSTFLGQQLISSTVGVNSHHRSCLSSLATTVSASPPVRRDSMLNYNYGNTSPLLSLSLPLQVLGQQPSMAMLMSAFFAGGSSGCWNYSASSFATETSTNTVSGSTLTEDEMLEYIDSMMSALMNGGVCGTVTQAKLEELERLTGGKDRLLNAATAGSTMGKFVMGKIGLFI